MFRALMSQRRRLRAPQPLAGLGRPGEAHHVMVNRRGEMPLAPTIPMHLEPDRRGPAFLLRVICPARTGAERNAVRSRQLTSRCRIAPDRRGLYPWVMTRQVKHRRRGYTRVSAKHQVTLPVATLQQAGLRTGDTLRAEVRGPGEILLVRDEDPIDRFAGALTGAYRPGELDELRDEWA